MQIVFSPPWLALPELKLVSVRGLEATALTSIGMNWEVIKCNLEYQHQRQTKTISNSRGLVRKDTGELFSIVSEKWNPIQHTQAFDTFQKICKQVGALPTAVGSLLDGKMLWTIGSFEEMHDVGMTTNLLLTNRHEYGRGMEYRTLITNEEGFSYCLALPSISRSLAFSVMDTVRRIMPALAQQQKQFVTASQILSQNPCSKELAFEYFDAVFPPSPLKAHNVPGTLVKELFLSREDWTWWDAFASVALAIDHLLGLANETRLTSAWFGVNSRRKVTALNLANNRIGIPQQKAG